MEERGEEDMRMFGPKSKGHPSIGKPCPVCGEEFVVGDFTALAAIGVLGRRDQERRDAGKVFNAFCVEVHWECSLKDEAM